MKINSVFITLSFLLSFISFATSSMSQTKQAPMLSFMILQRTQDNHRQVNTPSLNKNSEIENLMKNSKVNKEKTVNKSRNLKPVLSNVNKESNKERVDKKQILNGIKSSIQTSDAGKKLILL